MTCPTLLLYVPCEHEIYWTNTICPTLLLMVCMSRTQKFTEQIRFAPHFCWWYVRHEHKSLLNEYGLLHTVADGTYVASTKFTERIRFAPHCCWWYVHRKHRSLLKECCCLLSINNEWNEIRLLLNGTYPASTKFYEVLYTWQCACAAMSETQDRSVAKNVCKQFVYNQTVTLITLSVAFVKRGVIKMMNEGNGGILIVWLRRAQETPEEREIRCDHWHKVHTNHLLCISFNFILATVL